MNHKKIDDLRTEIEDYEILIDKALSRGDAKTARDLILCVNDLCCDLDDLKGAA